MGLPHHPFLGQHFFYFLFFYFSTSNGILIFLTQFSMSALPTMSGWTRLYEAVHSLVQGGMTGRIYSTGPLLGIFE